MSSACKLLYDEHANEDTQNHKKCEHISKISNGHFSDRIWCRFQIDSVWARGAIWCGFRLELICLLQELDSFFFFWFFYHTHDSIRSSQKRFVGPDFLFGGDSHKSS